MYLNSWSDDWHGDDGDFIDVATEGIAPEWRGDIREASAGCWHEVNGNYNSPMFDADHCRKPCVPGTRYCVDHQRGESVEIGVTDGK